METRQHIVAISYPHGEKVFFYRDKIVGIIMRSSHEEYLLEGGHTIRIDLSKDCDIVEGEF